MSYFKDLSDCRYTAHRRSGATTIGWLGVQPEDPLSLPRVKNIGWLASDHPSPTQVPSDEISNLLWDYCSISVVQHLGSHRCQFCPEKPLDWRDVGVRNGDANRLGSAEIRVFGADRSVYAAPTLLYHYVSVHHYRPPDEFIRAMKEGPRPPAPEYFGSWTD